jgi:hypothetical protein
MNQTTRMDPHLRGLGGASVPGVAPRHLIQMRSWPPANAALVSHPVHWFPATVGTPIRDGRFPVGLPTGHFASRYTLCQLHAGRTRAADSTIRQPIAVAFRLMPPGIFQ